MAPGLKRVEDAVEIRRRIVLAFERAEIEVRRISWLGEVPATNDELKALLVSFKDDALTMWRVDRQKIGNVRNKDREVALPEVVPQPSAGRNSRHPSGFESP